MKKLFTLSLVAICITQIAQAQIKKGSVSVGGFINGNYNNSFDNNNRKQNQSSGIQFSAAVGKAVKDNSVVGITLGYGHGTYDYNLNTAETKSRSNRYDAGVYWREHRKLAKDFYFFTELGAAFNYGQQHAKDSSGKKISGSHSYGAGVSLAPGVAYRLYKKLYVELQLPGLASVQYSAVRPDLPGTVKQNAFAISTSLSGSPLNNLGIGLRCIL